MTPTGRAVTAGTVAALVSGAPSTAWALASGDDPLAASRAAATLWPGREDDPSLARGVVVHLGVSALWTAVLALVARRRRITAARGAVAGLAIAVLDLGVIAPRRAPRVAALPTIPQIADHLLFGAVLGRLLAGRPPAQRPVANLDQRAR